MIDNPQYIRIILDDGRDEQGLQDGREGEGGGRERGEGGECAARKAGARGGGGGGFFWGGEKKGGKKGGSIYAGGALSGMDRGRAPG